jgi:hypothetical protein
MKKVNLRTNRFVMYWAHKCKALGIGRQSMRARWDVMRGVCVVRQVEYQANYRYMDNAAYIDIGYRIRRHPVRGFRFGVG